MKIQIPENVRMCGEGVNSSAVTESMTERVYLEDYVVTFLRQARDACKEGTLLIDLYGKRETDDGKTWFFVYAAGFAADEVRFQDYEWLGKAYWQWEKEPEEYIAQIQKVDDSLHAVLTGEDGEIVFFINEKGYVRRADTYFVFYEKNEIMQNFLIEWYRRNLKREERETADHAARNFRRLYQARQNDRHQAKMISLMYAASLMLLILCCITGISMMNQYDKMKQMGQSIDHLTLAMQERQLPERTYEMLEAEREGTEGDEIVANQEIEEETAIQAIGQSVEVVLPEETAVDEIVAVEDAAERIETESTDTTDIITAEPEYYIVKEGDTLAGISRILYGTSSRLVELCDLNRIQDPNNIIVGQKILLPKD